MRQLKLVLQNYSTEVCLQKVQKETSLRVKRKEIPDTSQGGCEWSIHCVRQCQPTSNVSLKRMTGPDLDDNCLNSDMIHETKIDLEEKWKKCFLTLWWKVQLKQWHKGLHASGIPKPLSVGKDVCRQSLLHFSACVPCLLWLSLSRGKEHHVFLNHRWSLLRSCFTLVLLSSWSTGSLILFFLLTFASICMSCVANE